MRTRFRSLDSINKNERKLKTLYLIDPTRNYDDLIDPLKKADKLFSNTPQIFVPNKIHPAMLHKGLLELSFDITGRLEPYKTVNTNFDTDLYRLALKTSKAFFHIFQSCQRAGLGTADTHIPPYLIEPFSIAFHDRFVSQMRQVLELKEVVERLDIQQIIFFPRPSALGRSMSKAIENILPECNIITTLDHTPERVRNFHIKQPDNRLVSLREKLFDLPLPKAIHEPETGRVMFGTNLRDKQYRKTALPVVKKLLETTPVTIIDAAVADLNLVFEEFDLESERASGHLAFFEKVKPNEPTNVHADEVRLIDVLGRRLELYVKANGILGGFAPIFVTYLRLFGLPVIKLISALNRLLKPHIEVAKRIVVTPGRTLESGVMVQIARQFGIPSIEIQSGTISKNSRFTKPQADYVLAIETFSKDVYSGFMGFPAERIEIVGGPKIEHDISPMRGIKQESLRHKTKSLLTVPKDRKVVLFASQPVGIEKSKHIFETILTGLNRSKLPITILIKPHPNEDHTYHDLYLNHAKAAGHDVIIDTSITALEAIIISDLVMTYYSTVGLEAFALERPVISVNPFEEPVPYDLTQLGVAHEASDPYVLEFLLQSWHEDGWPKSTADSSLKYLQDGLTMDRTVNMILNPELSIRV